MKIAEISIDKNILKKIFDFFVPLHKDKSGVEINIQIEEGLKFIYLGTLNECRNCKLKNVCFNLKPGTLYIVNKVRDKKHQCNIHQGDTFVVEVHEIPITTSINKRLSEGSISIIKKNECKKIECKNYHMCHFNFIFNDEKYKILKIHGNIECPLGYKLNIADIIRV